MRNPGDEAKSAMVMMWERLKSYFPNKIKGKHLLWVIGGGIVATILLLIILAILTYSGFFGRLPNYAELRNIKNHVASEVYSEDGQLLRKYYIENRVNADFDEIPDYLVEALIATEDARFFNHQGIDFRAWVRVFLRTVLLQDESGGGGSTLSQQLVKNLYDRQSYPVFSIMVNKLKETFIARRLEHSYSKTELLKLYLNTVPFGDNVYGIKVASRHFFGKQPDHLTIEEAAVLIGMLKANTYYNPIKHPDRARQRRNVVLGQMVRYGYLEKVVFDSLINRPLEVMAELDETPNTALYFTEYLRQELAPIVSKLRKPNGDPYDLYRDGLKIYTTINSRLQKYAEQAVREHLSVVQKNYYNEWRRGTPWGKRAVLDNAIKSSNRYKSLAEKGYSEASIDSIFRDTIQMSVFNWKDGQTVQKEMSPLDSIKYYLTLFNAGFLAMNPRDGAIKAWVGGVNYKYFQYDHVRSKRQVGSIFKPVVYTRALEGGMLPCEYTENRLVTYVNYENWEPRNADGIYQGAYSMEGALTHSVNTVSVDILLRAGIDSVAYLANQMGLNSEIPMVPSIALGTMDGSLYDMVQVYGTLANRGKRPEHHFLDRIEDSEGNILFELDRPSFSSFEQVVNPYHADMVMAMLQSVVDSGTARKLRYEYRLYQDIAGKTGTTQKHADGWFVGITPDIVAGVWVGADLPVIHFKTLRNGQGASTALPIWGRFMQLVNQDDQFRSWRKNRFPELSEEQVAFMSCPHFLNDTLFLNDGWMEEREAFVLLSEVLPFTSQEMIIEMMQDKPRRHFESVYDYVERMQKYHEKLESRMDRREERKAFWSKLLFKKKHQ